MILRIFVTLALTYALHASEKLEDMWKSLPHYHEVTNPASVLLQEVTEDTVLQVYKSLENELLIACKDKYPFFRAIHERYDQYHVPNNMRTVLSRSNLDPTIKDFAVRKVIQAYQSVVANLEAKAAKEYEIIFFKEEINKWNDFLIGVHSLNTDDRPDKMKRKIKEVFESLAQNDVPVWYLNGPCQPYHCCYVMEEKWITHCIQENFKRGQKRPFWILDVGTGCFGWGRFIAQYIEQQVRDGNLPSDIDVRIVGVTAEGKSIVQMNKIGPCTLYYFTRFPIEEMKTAWGQYHDFGTGVASKDAEERQRFKDVKFDFVTTRSTFQHLVDPFGTLVDVYRLIAPGGMFVGEMPLGVSNSGRILFDSRFTFCELLPSPNLNFFTSPTSSPLVVHCGGLCFIKGDNELILPIKYNSDGPQYSLRQGFEKSSHAWVSGTFNFVKGSTLLSQMVNGGFMLPIE